METIIATITKNAFEEVHVELGKFRGHDLVSVRIYANYGSAESPKRPTKKGVTLKVEKLPDLILALQEAERQAVEAGLLSTKEKAA